MNVIVALLFLFAVVGNNFVAGTTSHATSTTTTATTSSTKDYLTLRNENANLKLRNEFEDLLSDFHTAAEQKYKRLRDEILGLREELAEVRSTRSQEKTALGEGLEGMTENSVILLVSKLLEQHQHKSRKLEARMDAIENNQVSTWEETEPSSSEMSTHPTRRHLAAVDSSVLEDAAVWMQAKNAKILFGSNADTNLYRSAEAEMTTDSNFVIKRDLNVMGENWHLTTMMTARENITAGDVISLCGGQACVGYGLANIGFMASSQPCSDIQSIFLGGSNSLVIMYYRRWTGTSHQSVPHMRLIKPLHSIAKDYSGDPFIGDERNIDGTVEISELRMATITDTSFMMVYRKTGSSTATNIQGGIRLGELVSVDDSTLSAADEVTIPLVKGFGFKRGIPIRLGTTKYAVAFEHTDKDTDQKWLGTGSIAIGTIGGGSAGNRGVTIGGALEFGQYVSDLTAVSFNNDKHVALAYREQNSLGTVDRGVITLIDTSTSIPKIVTSVVFNKEQTRFMDITRVNTKSVCIVYREPKRNFIGKGLLVELIQSDTQLLPTTPVPVADESSIDNSYALSVTLIREGQLVLSYRNAAGKPRLVDADVVGTTIVVGTPRKFAPEDHVSSSYSVSGLRDNAFMLVYQDNEANTAQVATSVLGMTHGGALRTGVASSSGGIGSQVQVAMEGAVTVPIGNIKVNGAAVAMTPGARYYAKYDGGISPSSDDGVLLGRALRDSLLLLERDFAGGFRIDTSGASQSSAYVGEMRALAGATVPAGWLVCDGSAVNRIDFSALFAAIGVVWGNGDTATTFNVPDLRGRTMIGAGQATNAGSVPTAKFTNAEATNHLLGQYDGAERFRMTLPSRVEATVSSTTEKKGNSQHSPNKYVVITTTLNKGSFNPGSISTKTGTTSTSSTQSSNTDGVGFAQINMMPYAAITYIIKT